MAGVRGWVRGLSLVASILASPFGADDPGVKAPSLSHLYSDSGKEDGYRLVWRARIGDGADARHAIFTRTVDSSGRTDGAPRLLVDPGPGGHALTPAVSSGVLVWVERRRGGRWAVHARNVEPGGKRFRLSRRARTAQGRPAILRNQSNRNLLVAWAGSGHRGVRARVVHENGKRATSKVLTVAPAADRVSDPTLANRQAGFTIVLWTRTRSHDMRLHGRLVRTGTNKLNRPRALAGIDPRRVLDSDSRLTAVADEPTPAYDHLLYSGVGVAWSVRVHDSAGRRASAIVAQVIDTEVKHRLDGPMTVALARNPGRSVRHPRLAFSNKTELWHVVWAREASDGCGRVERALLRSAPSWQSRPLSRTVLSSPSDPGGCDPRHPTLASLDPSASPDGRVLYAWESGRHIAGAIR